MKLFFTLLTLIVFGISSLAHAQKKAAKNWS